MLLINCKHNELIDNKNFTINKPLITTCTSDTSHSYIVYLPTQYDSTQLWPVIFCFDPQGEAEKPIDSLKKSAEQYGYIIIASTKIKNKIENLNYDLNTLYSDVLNKFYINRKKMYNCGFSGGARIASKMAGSNNLFKGIISCGAGLNKNLKFSNHQKIFCITGNQDFNYMEVKKSVEQLPNIGLIVFEGEHKWPPKNILGEVLYWWYIQDKPDKAKIFNKSAKHEIKNLQNKSVEKAYELARNSIIVLNTLVKTKNLKKEKFKIQKSKKYKRYIKTENQIFNQEHQLQAYYYSAFINKDTLWWKNEIINLNTQSASNSIEYILMKKRIRNFVSMISYMFTSQAIDNNNIPAIEKYLYIYKLADEYNPDYLFFKAVYYYRINNINASKVFLKKALDKGFNKPEEVKNKLLFSNNI